MKLWLDDWREAPEGWTWVKTVDDAIAALSNGGCDDLHLDHDLGGGRPVYDHEQPTGNDLVMWMVVNEKFPRKRILVHSINPQGAVNMAVNCIAYITAKQLPVTVFVRALPDHPRSVDSVPVEWWQ